MADFKLVSHRAVYNLIPWFNFGDDSIVARRRIDFPNPGLNFR